MTGKASLRLKLGGKLVERCPATRLSAQGRGEFICQKLSGEGVSGKKRCLPDINFAPDPSPVFDAFFGQC